MAELMDINLHGPGMTSLHKAGLAGLYMTLQAFERDGITIPELNWQLAPDVVRLIWSGETPKAALTHLIKQSFRIDNDGFIRLTGLEGDAPPRKEQLHLLYRALLNTFLQFGPHRPTHKARILSYEVDDRPVWIKEFSPIKKYRHQEAAKSFVDGKGQFRAEVEVSGWLFPGAGKRHVAFGGSKFGEPPALAMCLLFAPVGGVFFLLSSRLRGRKARAALVLPKINDLGIYAKAKALIASQGVLQLTAAGPTDAALRLALICRAREEISVVIENAVLRVLTFGIVDWNEKQKSRTAVYTVQPDRLGGIGNYETAFAVFPNRLQRVAAKRNRKDGIIEPEHYFVATYGAREIIADNIANSQSWFHGFAEYMADKDLRKRLGYERKELNEMVNQAQFDDEAERQLVRACHEAWRRRLGALGERARRENASFSVLANRDYERTRISFARCKNATTLRETLIDFLARSGGNSVLREQWSALLPLLDERHWRKVRDLALLALVSYQPANAAEAEAMDDMEETTNE